MVTYHYGDLLESRCDIIAHQVNLQGVMGGGLALQIAKKYIGIEKAYEEFSHKAIIGDIYLFKIDEDRFIANCFTQDERFNTDYKAIWNVFLQLKLLILDEEIKTIGVPKNYGCGIANGDWEKVEDVFKNIFEIDDKIDLQIWEI